MAKGLVNIESLNAIANAIREKLGTTATYKPAEMAPAILSIPTGGTGEEIPKIYVAKKLEHQSIVITPSALTASAEIGDKKVYSASVSSIDIKVVPAVGYEAGNIVVNGNVMSKEVSNYTIAGGEQITATAATKIGDSPTLDIHGTLVFTENGEDTLIATSDKINTTSAGYHVNNVYAQRIEDYLIVEINIPGIEEFYSKPGIYTTSIINVKIGDVLFDMTREGPNGLSGGSAKADFVKLKENVGKPLNFSIKYE